MCTWLGWCLKKSTCHFEALTEKLFFFRHLLSLHFEEQAFSPKSLSLWDALQEPVQLTRLPPERTSEHVHIYPLIKSVLDGVRSLVSLGQFSWVVPIQVILKCPEPLVEAITTSLICIHTYVGMSKARGL